MGCPSWKSFDLSVTPNLLWVSLPITTGHTSQWKRKGFHAKHNKREGQGGESGNLESY
jgi:hypothetical protein